MGNLLRFFWIDTYTPDAQVPVAALMEFRQESPSIAEKREASIAYLRKGETSRYVLDGANVNWSAPTVLRRAA